MVGDDLVAVIPTKDRPSLVLALLHCLHVQGARPTRVIVVDASEAAFVVAGPVPWPDDWVQVIHHSPPSAAAQRNRGVAAVADHVAFVALLDDDVRLAPHALSHMLRFWHSGDVADVVGAGFNQCDAGVARPRGGCRHGRLAGWLGLYHPRPGGVASSGWQSMIGPVERDLEVEWLPTGAAVWRLGALRSLGGFDEFFTGYSYLEDVELSMRARRQGRLVVVADARYEHGYATAGKVDAFAFGRVEVRNRLHLVRKHRLSLGRCALGLTIRATMTLSAAIRQRDRALWLRFVGNLRGALEVLWR